MSFFHDVTRKPWLAEQGAIDDRHARAADAPPVERFGLRMFFAVVAVLFSLLSVAYAERMAVVEWRVLPESWLLWFNLAVLLLASVAFQWAKVELQRGRLDVVWTGFVAGGLLTLVFLAGQLLAWQQLADSKLYTGTSPANSFFYTITGLHGLHMLGGLVAWGRTMVRLRQAVPAMDSIRLSVNLCTSYWHFLTGVWLALFILLFLPGGSLPVLCRAFI